MSKRSILVILLILMPLSLLLASDFIIESDGWGNTLLVEYFGYDRHVEIPDGVNIIGSGLLTALTFYRVFTSQTVSLRLKWGLQSLQLPKESPYPQALL